MEQKSKSLEELQEFGQPSEKQDTERGQKKEPLAGREVLVRFCYFPAACLFSEIVLRLCIYRGFPEGTTAAMLQALAAGCVFTLLTLCFPVTLNRIFCYLGLTGIALYANIQLLYFTVFQRFFSFRLMAVGTDVFEFKQQIFSTMAARWYGILLLLVPLLFRILLDAAGYGFQSLYKGTLLYPLGATLLLKLCFLGVIFAGRSAAYSGWELYVHDWEATLGTQKLGFFTSAGMDIKEILFGREGDDLEEVLLTGRPVTPFVQEEVTPVPSVPGDEMGSGEITGEITPTAVPTPPVFHELYDFAKLAEQESNKEIKTLHTYFSGLSPEKENEYTGKFAGYNLILLTAEAFSPLAVDKELTPTLYKLTHSGFVFENFYTPLWYTSTSDGEYVACTGLLPDGANSMTRSAKNDMRFAFGNQFAAIGYQTLAYHNHKYSYYSRDKSHPNLGYTYKGIGNGLLLPSTCWPRSDLEMMEVTVPEYIDREPFHVYYMTVSGHMEYTFTDNTMANRNRGVVEDLPYSEPAKAYLACNYELEKALTYLLERLEAEGIAEHTVIALSADHYPYGLEKQYIDELAGHEVEENFELYKNYFILWSAGMEEKITIEKYCSGLDIAPTLANLFGLPYDSRLYAGSDILSDQEGLVIFDNKSFITDRVAYNAVTGTATPLNGATVTEEYLEGKKREVKQKFAMSKGILVNDYFSYLPK